MTLPEPLRLGPVRLVVTDRLGGVSRSPYDTLNLADHVGDAPAAVAVNRRLAAGVLGVGDVAVVKAEHGARVRVVDGPGTAEPADVLITRAPGLGMLALSADCVAGVLVDADLPALAVFHSGWRGVAADAVGAAVGALVGLGARPDRLTALLGPSICGACYEVSQAVQDEVAAAAPVARCSTRRGTPGVDIAAGVRWQLERSGVARISADARCTAEDDGLFSHRRDGATGRQGILAALS